MEAAVKKTISLPSDLARELEEVAQQEGKSFSAVVRETLRSARNERLEREWSRIQGYWSKKARELGILTEADLQRYLEP